MRRVTRNGVFAVAAASGAMALTMPAHADSAAEGVAAGSPGVISGNTVQLPVHVPVNVCGNTVNVVGLLNPAAGNTCVSEGGDGKGSGGGATAQSAVQDSPGVISGNGVQLPVGVPVNVSGNTVDVVGIGNPVFGNESENSSGGEGPKSPGKPEQPGTPDRPGEPGTPDAPVKPRPETGAPPVKAHPEPAPAPQAERPPAPTVLADTGTDAILSAAVGATALVLGGAALRRRFRPGDGD
ncbi:chaplin family protein [Streptomyces sp. NPDC052687]|uniref:chaplin n=1 Tax=Streptomyces sp. NPDC052687 TaxID=3154759 RepID=UPI003430B5D2